MKKVIVWVIAISGVCHAWQWETLESEELDGLIARVATEGADLLCDTTRTPIIVGLMKRIQRTGNQEDVLRLDRATQHKFSSRHCGKSLYTLATELGLDPTCTALISRKLALGRRDAVREGRLLAEVRRPLMVEEAGTEKLLSALSECERES